MELRQTHDGELVVFDRASGDVRRYNPDTGEIGSVLHDEINKPGGQSERTVLVMPKQGERPPEVKPRAEGSVEKKLGKLAETLKTAESLAKPEVTAGAVEARKQTVADMVRRGAPPPPESKPSGELDEFFQIPPFAPKK